MTMRTVYFGNNVDYLQVLRERTDVRAIVLHDRDSGFGTPSFLMHARATRLPIHRPHDVGDIATAIQDCEPDLIVVGSYHQLIPRTIFSIARKGAINVHPSLLPRYRGQHVINWVLVNGERETGVTIHELDERFDTGRIIAQERLPIDSGDDALSLSRKLSTLGAALLRDVVERFERGPVIGTPQNEGAATRVRSRTPQDGRMDLRKPAREIRNLVRALVRPWPGAFCDLINPDGSRGTLTCYACEVIDAPAPTARARGEVVDVGDGIRAYLDGDQGLHLLDYAVQGADVRRGSLLC